MKKITLFLVALTAILCCGCSNDGFGKDWLGGTPGDNFVPDGDGENYEEYAENEFVNVLDEPVSTFSVDADGGAYANMRRQLSYGSLPVKESVRIEEFLNYFTFDYPEPSDGENIALNGEMAVCPWAPGHHVVRLGIKGRELPESEYTNSNYVLLIDVSGSMSDNMELLKRGFCRLVDKLTDRDYVSIVTYAGKSGVLLQSTPVTGDNRTKIKKAINNLKAGGSTAGEAGIQTAYEQASKNFIEGGNNRVVLISDGDFNVGVSSVDELKTLISQKRETGVFLTTIGVGSGNFNDAMMEQLANKGNGTYEYIDCPEEIERVFIENFSRFYSVANDTKIQITFNPAKVERYRLIGYENRRLANEDFERDSTDAGEIGAGQTITALYEVVLTDSAATTGGEYLKYDVKYKRPSEAQSRPMLTYSLAQEPVAVDKASENMRFALAVSAYGLILRRSEYKGDASYSMVYELGTGATDFDPYGHRSRFFSLVDKAESLPQQ